MESGCDQRCRSRRRRPSGCFDRLVRRRQLLRRDGQAPVRKDRGRSQLAGGRLRLDAQSVVQRVLVARAVRLPIRRHLRFDGLQRSRRRWRGDRASLARNLPIAGPRLRRHLRFEWKRLGVGGLLRGGWTVRSMLDPRRRLAFGCGLRVRRELAGSKHARRSNRFSLLCRLGSAESFGFAVCRVCGGVVVALSLTMSRRLIR
jgi:hypothetical protein